MGSKYLTKIEKELKLLANLSDEDLIKEAQNFKSGKHKKSKFIPKAIALVKEATTRAMESSQYDNQVLAAIELFKGNIVELKPGEGKSLVILLTAFLHVLSGKKVHIMVENDFYVQRDFQKAFNVFRYLDISVGSIPSKKSPEYEQIDKTKMYECDILYVHPIEVCFDYLKSEDKTYISNTALIIDDIDRVIATPAPTSIMLVSETGDSNENILLINYIKKYSSFAGIGDSVIKEKKFYKKYLKKNVVEIQNNLPNIRAFLPNDISRTKEEKFDKILQEVMEVHKYRCPVIIVVPNDSELKMMTSRLDKKGFRYNMATKPELFMDIFNISQAGRLNSITVVSEPTGIDVPLGGDAFYYTMNSLNLAGLKPKTPEWNKKWEGAYNYGMQICTSEYEETKKLGGIYTIITEHSYNDDVLEAYSARRGDPGSVKYFISLEDDFLKNINMTRFLSIINTLNLDENKIFNNPAISSFIVKLANFVNKTKTR